MTFDLFVEDLLFPRKRLHHVRIQCSFFIGRICIFVSAKSARRGSARPAIASEYNSSRPLSILCAWSDGIAAAVAQEKKVVCKWKSGSV